MRRRLAVLVPFLVALAVVPSASAATYLPPPGRFFSGTGGTDLGLASSFTRLTGVHPSVFQMFLNWGGGDAYIRHRLADIGARGMAPVFHLSTGQAGAEIISPGAVASGAGDDYLVRLNADLAAYGKPVYLRPFAEMDAYWNAFSAYDAGGGSRGAAHSTRSFRRMWQRTVIVLRGGPVAGIDAALRGLGMTPLRTAATELPRPQVAFMWVPQVAGAPDTRANAPLAYWPGSRYVDWIGTDFYSGFPNWRGLNSFYGQFARFHKPFVFGEYAIWKSSDQASWIHQLYAWGRSHGTRMYIYNQGGRVSPLSDYPRAAAALRAELRTVRFQPVP